MVTWRRAQMGLLSAQGTDAAAIAKVAFTSEDRVGLRMPRAAAVVRDDQGQILLIERVDLLLLQ